MFWSYQGKHLLKENFDSKPIGCPDDKCDRREREHRACKLFKQKYDRLESDWSGAVWGSRDVCRSFLSWETGICLDSHRNDQNTEVILLGKFEGQMGKWSCLYACYVFGYTGCEFEEGNGFCATHTHDVKYANGVAGSECYIMPPYDGKCLGIGIYISNNN